MDKKNRIIKKKSLSLTLYSYIDYEKNYGCFKHALAGKSFIRSELQ